MECKKCLKLVKVSELDDINYHLTQVFGFSTNYRKLLRRYNIHVRNVWIEIGEYTYVENVKELPIKIVNLLCGLPSMLWTTKVLVYVDKDGNHYLPVN